MPKVPNEIRENEMPGFLSEFEEKLQLLRDRVDSVVNKFHTGAYFVGRPGTSKTFTVKEKLEASDVPSVYQNARMTAAGLYEFLADHPEHVIVLDDIPSLFKNEQAMQTLLAALDGEPGQPRKVTYKSKDKEDWFWFSGAIIAISNYQLRCDPMARALGSRIVMVEHEPTDEEIGAFMRHLSNKGYADLSAEECREVAEFIIDETRAIDLRLDLRHLTKAWQDFRQDKQGLSMHSWKDLVRSSLRKPLVRPEPLSKQEEIEEQRNKVREAIKDFPNDTLSQIESSGLSKSTFYNRRKEIKNETRAA